MIGWLSFLEGSQSPMANTAFNLQIALMEDSIKVIWFSISSLMDCYFGHQ